MGRGGACAPRYWLSVGGPGQAVANGAAGAVVGLGVSEELTEEVRFEDRAVQFEDELVDVPGFGAPLPDTRPHP